MIVKYKENKKMLEKQIKTKKELFSLDFVKKISERKDFIQWVEYKHPGYHTELVASTTKDGKIPVCFVVCDTASKSESLLG